MNLSGREKIMLTIAFYALIIFCFVWFLYLPQQARIAAVAADNQLLSQEKTRLEAIRKKQEQSTPVNNNIAQDMAMVNEQLPTQEEMIPVLKFLDESTAKYGVAFSSLDYQGAKQDESETKALTFTVMTQGSIFDLIDFLQELLAAPRFISVADVSLTACKAEKSGSDEEKGEPTYYIAPPGIPEAKLQRVRVEVEEEETSDSVEQRVADSFIPDKFDMKVTINAYYSPEEPGQETAGAEAPEGAENQDSEGRI